MRMNDDPLDERHDDSLDERLDRALRELPREGASPGFTANVMRRVLREPQDARRRATPARWLVPAGAAFLLLATLLGYRDWADERQRRVALAEIAEIRAEKQVLAAEIEALRRQLDAEARPVVPVGRVGDVELVVDLGRLARSGAFPADTRPAAGTRPAVGSGDMPVERAVYAW